MSVAIITGGASGIGLEVARALSTRQDWIIHLLDRDLSKGQAAAEALPKTTFHQVDVASYGSLATAFQSIFAAHGKLNFVFANAGIAVDPKALQGDDGSETPDEPPSAPSLDMLAVNLHSVIFTTTLAQHYFRLSTSDSGPRSIVITASSASFYASPISPMYCASKHGVLGWTRSVAPAAWKQDRVAVNAICPGIVRTSILPDEMFAMFPEQVLTPVSKVVEVVLMLLDGDSAKANDGHAPFGQAVEICGTSHYYREQLEYCDGTMAAVMGATAGEG